MNESKEKKSNFKTKLNTSKSSVTKRIRKTIKTVKRGIFYVYIVLDTGYSEWSKWGPWTVCSKQCGGGLMKRKRDCSSTDMPCPGSPEEEKDCNTQACAAPTTSVPVTATWNPARTDAPFVC